MGIPCGFPYVSHVFPLGSTKARGRPRPVAVSGGAQVERRCRGGAVPGTVVVVFIGNTEGNDDM